MDLHAAKYADRKAVRLSRAGMIACFVFASVMLLASLAMAKGFASPFSQTHFSISLNRS